jgi:hypothetical protein
MVEVAAWGDCAPADVIEPVSPGAGCEESSAGGSEEHLTKTKDLVLGVVLTVLSVICIVTTHFHLKSKTLEDY